MTKWQTLHHLSTTLHEEEFEQFSKRITYEDVVNEAKKIPLLSLFLDWKVVQCGVDFDSYPFFYAFNANGLIPYFKNDTWTTGQCIGFYDLLFIKITDDTWSVHYKYEDNTLKKFETMDFRPYIEQGLLETILEAMLEGPESYWDVDTFHEVKHSASDKIVEKHLLSLKQARQKKYEDFITECREKLLIKQANEITEDDLPI